jgi:Ribbon-helix-helix protein, copG family
MKRTTISLPDDLAAALEREAARRRVPVSQVAREAIEARLGPVGQGPRELPFAGLFASGRGDAARHVDEILATEWPDAILGDR